ncbi:MAG: pilus assembly protein PilP [Nitrospirota bacterium]
MSKKVSLFLLLTAIIFMPACQGGEQTTKNKGIPLKKSDRKVARSKKEVKTDGNVLEAIEEEQLISETSYDYTPLKRRDPFRSIIVVKSGIKKKPAFLLPLQKVELSKLKVTGIIWGGFGYMAMIETPDNKGFPVKKGTMIGTNNGKVKNITPENIVVEERISDIFGEEKRRDIVLELYSQEETIR